MKKNIYVFFIIFSATIFYHFFYSNKDSIKEIEDCHYSGIILEKFLDEKNHGVSSFSIRTDKKYITEIADYFIYSWDYAQAGDSIFKRKGELSITIKRKNGNNRVFFLDKNIFNY